MFKADLVTDALCKACTYQGFCTWSRPVSVAVTNDLAPHTYIAPCLPHRSIPKLSTSPACVMEELAAPAGEEDKSSPSLRLANMACSVERFGPAITAFVPLRATVGANLDFTTACFLNSFISLIITRHSIFILITEAEYKPMSCLPCLQVALGCGAATALMIKYLLVANTGAAVLIARFYEHVPRASQQELQEAVVRLCLARSDKQSTIVDYEDYTVVYKKFSSVVFIAGITKDENELAIIELFRHIGETLIKYFGNLERRNLIYCIRVIGRGR
ncbi:AP4S-like protein [Mya arenaria]|uniref:AP4S-like protein n=1 Tax=Mya arenaria TaxID=6604 RepID=A0ABY7FBW3_MYAAR|nr:AP4S-like protein [Mya arenaria]